MFELNGGVRLERAEGQFRNVPLTVYPPGTAPLTPLQLAAAEQRGDLFSYRVGAVFKPTADTSLYVAYGNARTPSSATVRLGCGVVTAPALPIPAPSRRKPRAITRSAARRTCSTGGCSSPRPCSATSAPISGCRPTTRRCRRPAGARRPLAGRRHRAGRHAATSRRDWTIFANYTYLDGEVLQSVSDFCLANPGAAGCDNSAAVPDPQAGDRLIQTPQHSGSLFTTYRLPFGLEIGYGLTYQGGFATHQRNLLQRTQYFAEDYLDPPRLPVLCVRQRADRAAQHPESSPTSAISPASATM